MGNIWFFDVLENNITDLHLEGKANQILNCDDTSFSSDPLKTKIVGPVSRKCTRMISTCRKENTTVFVCYSAFKHFQRKKCNGIIVARKSRPQ